MSECRICHKPSKPQYDHALGSFCSKDCFRRLIDCY